MFVHRSYFVRTITAAVCAFTIQSSYAHKHDDLVDVMHSNPTFMLDIRYATSNNFTGQTIYTSARCFLRRSVAERLDAVQRELASLGLGLKIWDGYRPLSAQWKLWNIVPDERYVSDPRKGGRHTRGTAVDCTLVDLKTGTELSMPTEFDDFTEKAHCDYMQCSEEQIKNRTLLKSVMEKHGFTGLATEWWHFDAEEWKQFEPLDIDIATL